MHIFHLIVIIFTALHIACFSEEEENPVLFHHVNVITGDLNLALEETMVEGAVPLSIQRTYTSAGALERDEKDSDLYLKDLHHGFLIQGGWSFFSHAYLLFVPAQPGHPSLAYVADRSGSVTTFEYTGSENDLLILKPRGSSNKSFGKISGKNNTSLSVLKINCETGDGELFHPDGTKSYYIGPSRKERKKKDSLGIAYLYLVKEELPSQQHILYEYDRKNRLISVKTSNRDETKVYASCTFALDKVRTPYHFSLATSDGKEFDYQFKDINHRDYLVKATGQGTAEQGYDYTKDRRGLGARIKEISLDGMVQYRVSYHNMTDKEKEAFHRHPKNKPFRADKVEKIEAPFGAGGAYIPIASYSYEEGITRVRDAENLLIEYTHEEGKPLLITYYDEQDSPRCYVKFLWDHNNMICKMKLDKDKTPIFSKTFVYDDAGNVIKETFWGNISSTASESFVEGPFGLLLGAEHSSKTFRYDSAKQLLIEEREDSGLCYSYNYLEGTNLLCKKLTSFADSILQREFYEYDEDYLLSCKIYDDGIGAESSDLTRVSERHITRYKRDEKNGQIIECQDLYLDLDTQQEKQLQRKEFCYGPHQKVCEQIVFDADNRLCYTTKKKYNTRGQVTEETTPTGRKNRYSYDSKGRMVSCKEVGSLEKRFYYDSAARLCREEEIDKKGRIYPTTLCYDVKGRLLKKTDPMGHSISQSYDFFGRCISSETTAVVDEEGTYLSPTIYFDYDRDGNLASTTGPCNEVLKTEYNSLRKPTVIISSDGAITKHSYTYCNTIATTMHPDGTREVFSYDPFKRMTSKKIYSFDDDLLYEETWIYNAFHLLSHTDTMGLTTEYIYDGAGRLIEQKKEDRISRYEYDALGYLERSYQGDICTVQIHNHSGQVVETWKESPHFVKEGWMSFVFDDEDCKITAFRQTSQNKTKDTFTYDERLRLTSHTSPLGHTTQFVYADDLTDPLGQRLSQKTTIDPQGDRLIETFDAQGRIKSRQRQDSQGTIHSEETIVYDKAGNKQKLITSIYLDGQKQKTHTISWCYDVAGRVIKENDQGERVTTFAYDERGRLIKKGLSSGVSLFYEYDGLGRLLEERSSDGTIDFSFHYYRGKEPLFLIDEVTGHTLERHYNNFSELVEEISSDGMHYKWSYDMYGRCTAMTLPDSSFIRYEYTDQHMTKVIRERCDGRVYCHSYDHFDANGHVERESLILGHGKMQTNHDSLERAYRLSSPFHQCHVDFDSAGRVTKKSCSLTDDKIYAYDPLGQLTQENDHYYHFDSAGSPSDAVIGPCHEMIKLGSLSMSYDLVGCMREKRSEENKVIYSYDSLSRLTKIETDDGKTVTFSYDALGRLRKKTDATGDSFYLYDQNFEIGSMDESGVISELKILGLALQADIGASVAIEIGDDIYLPLHDLAGNIISLIAEDGMTKETYLYDSFGRSQTKEPLINPWRFSSKRIVSELIFFGVRFYDPEIGRWLTPDPSGYGDGVNLYLFVLNAPTNRLDLFGLSADPLYPFPDIKIDAPMQAIIAEPTFRNVHNFKGSIDGVEVDWLIKGGNWSKLSFSSEELSTGKVNLFHHFHEVIPQEGKMIGLVSFQNGIRTSLPEAAEMVNKISSWAPENTLVMSLYSPSTNIFSDVAAATQEIMLWKETQMTALTRQYFTAMSTQLCKINPEAFWLHIAHSRAGGIATRAIEGMSDEQKENMANNFLYLGVAPSIAMPKHLCARSLNIYSEYDRITGRFGKKVINHPDYNLEIIKCITPMQDRLFSPLFADHAFLGDTYSVDILDKLSGLNKEFGIYHEKTR